MRLLNNCCAEVEQFTSKATECIRAQTISGLSLSTTLPLLTVVGASKPCLFLLYQLGTDNSVYKLWQTSNHGI